MFRFSYDPNTYPEGVPNPYGVRVHAWKGGPLNEGTRYHGPVYTRPMFDQDRWAARPLGGLGFAAEGPRLGGIIALAALAGILAGASTTAILMDRAR